VVSLRRHPSASPQTCQGSTVPERTAIGISPCRHTPADAFRRGKPHHPQGPLFPSLLSILTGVVTAQPLSNDHCKLQTHECRRQRAQAPVPFPRSPGRYRGVAPDGEGDGPPGLGLFRILDLTHSPLCHARADMCLALRARPRQPRSRNPSREAERRPDDLSPPRTHSRRRGIV